MLQLRGKVWRTAAALLAAVLAGCGEAPAPQSKSAPLARKSAPVELVVTVVGDPELAEGIELQRGAWQAASGGDFEVRRESIAVVGSKTAVEGDVIVFPSRLLGALVEHGDLQPMRESVLAKPELSLGDIYPAVRLEMKYGDKVYALPLGSPPLLACYRTDVIESLGGKAPATAAAFGQLANVVRDGALEGKGEPTAAGPVLATAGDAAAHMLMLRALAYTPSSRRPDVLFNPEDMAPRVAEPPFERALADLVAEQSSTPGSQPQDLPGAVGMVQGGSAGAAFGWPGIVGAPQDAKSGQSFVVAAAPVADQEYSPTQATWQKQTLPDAVVYMGATGRLMAVSEKSRNAVTAFQFVSWLSALDRVPQISARSRETLWFRRSQTGLRREWTGGLESRGDSEASAEAVDAALESDAPFLVPRIPGIDDYLAALSDAVRAAMSGAATPAAALKQAAGRFEEITEARGRKEQVRAYRRHLGLE